MLNSQLGEGLLQFRLVFVLKISRKKKSSNRCNRVSMVHSTIVTLYPENTDLFLDRVLGEKKQFRHEGGRSFN